MSRRPIHAVPLDARGPHVPLASCGCGVIQATDLEEPGIVIYVHRHATWPRVPPPDTTTGRTGLAPGPSSRARIPSITSGRARECPPHAEGGNRGHE